MERVCDEKGGNEVKKSLDTQAGGSTAGSKQDAANAMSKKEISSNNS